jgi:RNA exonuclease 4
MAVYRLHKKDWEKDAKPVTQKRKRKEKDEGDEEDYNDTKPGSSKQTEFPGGGRKGVSSGLSTVIKRHGPGGNNSASGTEKKKWWKELAGGSKASMKVQSS